jgi:hypothetical protein
MAGTGRRTGQGRKSAEARMAAASFATAGATVERPEPPDEFSDEEKAVWHKIVDGCPPDWFTPESIHLLAKLCSVVVMSDRLEARWRADDRTWLDKDDRVAYNAMIHSIAQLTTKLRLSPQSRFNGFEAKTRMSNRAPRRLWDGDDGDDTDAAQH